jgi:RimJ/RimL family protein N-acetyltransferase
VTELVTERLLLRRWRPEDLDPFAAICANPEVMRFIGTGRPLSHAQVRRVIAAFEQGWEARGFGLWAAELRDTGDLAGFVGLHVPAFLPQILPAVEVGFRLARSCWGRGLATEGARASLRHAFNDLGLDRVVSIRHPGNGRSGRVMDKLGLHYVQDTTVPSTGVPVVVSAISRGEWNG